jgi:preprotein translocase subunit SecF
MALISKRTNMFVVKYRKIFYIFSGLLILASLLSIIFWGLNPGIDFKGGSLLDVGYPNGRPSINVINTQLSILNLGAYSVRPAGDNEYIIRMRHIQDSERQNVLSALSSGGSTKIDEKQFDDIGPLLGVAARNKSIVSLLLVVIAIVLFIAFAFRQVSEPVSSWKYGLIAIVALLHDIIVPTGVFSMLGHFAGYEMDTLFITALLVILGFSIHDTIVVFDRVRENLKHNRSSKKTFEEIVGESIAQTFTRSINTSLTVLLSLIVLYFVGGGATQHFILALIVGIAAGTYSSIFIGSPLLVTIQKLQSKNRS